MGKIGKYIYGIINSNTAFHLFVPKDSLEGESGVDGVYTILYQDISAVVSDFEIVTYTHLPKDALARLLVKHQKIIEKIMAPGLAVIPMRLGTFAQSEVEVRNILNKGYTLIKNIMEKINNKIEIDLVATWSDFNSVLKEIGEVKEIEDFKQSFLSNPKGCTIDEQIKVGIMVKKLLDEKREKYAKEIQDTLKTVSQDYKMHEVMDDRMVINAAFLVDRIKQKDFDREVENLNTKFCERLNFRTISPLPPYSFYTLEIKKMQFEEVDWAREKMGILNDAISKDEIKKIFHRQAFISHPDKNPDRPEAGKEFDEIKRSYNILLDYAQACEQVGKVCLMFNEDEFRENAVLVKVRE